MTLRSYIIILTIAFCLTNVLSSCGQSSNNKKKQISKAKRTTNQEIDTSKTAIISLDQKGSYPFDSTYKPTKLTQDDINNIDSLLFECVADKDNKGWSIN